MQSSRPRRCNSLGKSFKDRSASPALAPGSPARNVTIVFPGSRLRPAKGGAAIAFLISCAVLRITSGRKPKFPLNGALDFLRQRGGILLLGTEVDVATLHIGARGFRLERFVEGAECVHLDFVVAAYVDAAEHGDQYGHAG